MIEVLKQALDALETEVSIDWTNNDEFNASAEKMHDAIASLHQAIAELESQEPVAWSCWQSCLNDDGTQTSPWVHRLSKFKPHESIINKDIVPLYTHPPQRTWQGLTDDEHCDIWYKESLDWMEYGKAIEAKLKEKNT